MGAACLLFSLILFPAAVLLAVDIPGDELGILAAMEDVPRTHFSKSL